MSYQDFELPDPIPTSLDRGKMDDAVARVLKRYIPSNQPLVREAMYSAIEDYACRIARKDCSRAIAFRRLT